MIVEEVMTKDVITVSPEDTVMEALKIARTNRIRHVPVTEGETLMGVVSDRDLRDVSPSILATTDIELLEQTKVKDIMVANVISVHPLDVVEEAARLLYEHKIGCLPVVKGGDRLVGIVTDGDILFCFVEMMGVLERGSVLRLEIPDKPGMMADVLEKVSEHNINVISVFLLPQDKEKKGYREFIIRLQTIDPSNVVRDIKNSGYSVVWPDFWSDSDEK